MSTDIEKASKELQDLVAKIPFFNQLAGNASVDDREVHKVEAIIRSMTKAERANPDVLNDSRKARIARGCGRPVKDINDILKRFKMMRDVMKPRARFSISGMVIMVTAPRVEL